MQIQVVLYRSERWAPRLVHALDSLTSLIAGSGVAVWDNDPGSSPSIEQACAVRKWHYVATEAGNVGFGRGHNALAWQCPATVEYLLLLNHDAVPFYDSYAQLLAVAEANPDAGLIEPAQFPNEHAKVFDPQTLETGWCAAVSLLVRRAAYQSLKGFDERFQIYCEDVDFSWRAWLAGWRCLYVPTARVLHVTGNFDLDKRRDQELRQLLLGGLFLRGKYFGNGEVRRWLGSLRRAYPPRLADELEAQYAAASVSLLKGAHHPRITLDTGFSPLRWQ
ncbi:MAG: glycosyltransferase family 2 protein [Candidatus Dormibacteria bacterium]